MSYYKKFGVVLNTSWFTKYLKRVYAQGITDAKALGVIPDFSDKDFTALLSGCGNENTAETFINFVVERNPDAKIIIVDMGREQIEAIRTLVKRKYSKLNVEVYELNILDLKSKVKTSSINWIETDGFIEYFDSPSLKRLLTVWHEVLKPNGYVSTRDCVTDGVLSRVADKIRIGVAKMWLGVSLFPHTRSEFKRLFSDLGFKYSTQNTGLYTYERFCLVKA